MTRTLMADFPDPRSIDAPPQAGLPPAPAGVELEMTRILVVDDDAGNRESLSRRLIRRGFPVETAEDGLSALAAVDAAESAGNGFGLILLDVMMPGMSGLEVLAKLRETRPATLLPVIMATANDTTADIVAALSAGANDYVTKPLDFAVVLARVQTQLQVRRSVQQILELEERLKQRNAELEDANKELRKAAEQMRRDLTMAAKVQASFLPSEADAKSVDGVRFAWRYDPCTGVAGDALNVCYLDPDHVGFYILDVSGHGVAAALTAVSAARFLAPAHDPDTLLVDKGPDGSTTIVPPAEVAARMSTRFSFNSDTVQFVTGFYGVLNLRTRRLDYVSAGHPPPVLIGPDRPTPITLDATGTPIGIGQNYEQGSVDLRAGDRLILYTDGVTESRHGDEMFGLDRVTELLVAALAGGESLETTLDVVRVKLSEWRRGEPATDDVSLLAIEVK